MKTGYCHIYNHNMPLDSITDRLHIGNRWLGHLGLAMYDNTARVHDPVMPRMLTCDNPDGLAGQSYSWVNRITDTWKGDTPFTLSASYSYDGLGRLTLSESSDKKYSEKLTFDLDANVTDVRRLYRGATIQWASAQEMEGPRILELHDASGPYYSESVGRFPAGEYTYGYDRCGRTISDGTRDATISYHKWLDLPRRINIGDGNFIQNSYLPDGTLTGRIFNTKRINTIVRVNSKGDTIVTQRRNDLRRSLRFFGSFEKEGTSLKVHTPEGYYAVKEGRHYQYIRNRQGSTMAVVNDAGEVVQRTGYYASGTPFVLPVDSSDGSVAPLDSVTDRLHIGNRWLGHLGLAMYDNTARVHDPVMPRMLTCDSRAVDYPGHSPFSHCAGNPANILDPSGDSLFVAPKYRETLNNSLQDVFGVESDKFYYTQSGMLTHNGNLKKLSRKQKVVLKGLNKILSEQDKTELIYGKSVTYTNNYGKTITKEASEASGALSILASDNEGSMDYSIILIDPSVTNFTVSEMIDENSIMAANYRDKTVETNTTDMLFHEFGHKIYQGQSQDKVLGYNNVVRKLLKLKPRRSDYEHNKFKF